MENNKEQWRFLLKLWTLMYWVSIGNGALVALVLMLVGVNKHSLWAAGLTVFNIVLSNFWISFCERKLEDE